MSEAVEHFIVSRNEQTPQRVMATEKSACSDKRALYINQFYGKAQCNITVRRVSD